MPLPTAAEIKAVWETGESALRLVAPDFTAKLASELTTIYGDGKGVLAEILPSVAEQSNTVTSSPQALFDGGFPLPRHVTPRFVERTPPRSIVTRALPHPDNPQYDSIAAHRLNLRIDLGDKNAIGIMHPRFRSGAKQITMVRTGDRNLSLYGNNESGIGVLEYEDLPSRRPYFKHADSVVRIRGDGDGVNIGSGTIISEHGLVATAAHVVPPGRVFTVDTIKGQFEAKVVAWRLDEKADRAALQLLGVPKDISFTVPPLTSSKLREGMRAATVGHAQGMTGKFASIGHYIQDAEFYASNFKGIRPTFALDSVTQGYSGGPIFDADGNVAVILTSMFRRFDGIFPTINRSTITGDRIEDLLNLIEEQKIG